MHLEGSIELTSIEMLEQLKQQNKPYIVYVSTEDCNVCKSIYPKMMDSISSYEVDVYSVDASRHQEIAGQLLVFSVPTIIVMVDQKEAYRESRFIQFDQFNRICFIACQEKS